MNVKSEFSIKDLENLSGVKAHTIRIWEKRYQLLDPSRTNTNIRKYDLQSLKKLLNVSYLYNDGYKISKIAGLTDIDILRLINSKSHQKNDDYAIKAFKTAMFDFDNQLFNHTFNKLLEQKRFSEIFQKIFIPLLKEIGILWQTGTIDPVHESFISELIKQKIIINIAVKQQAFKQNHDTVFALFLPFQEVHEIGLLFANYELTSAGFRTIYLGANIPMNNLKNLLNNSKDIIFLTYLTVQPENKDITTFLRQFVKIICQKHHCELWTMGSKIRNLDKTKLPPNIQIISNFDDFNETLERLKNSQSL